MEIVMKETERLNRIITDFLNFSHPNKNQSTVVDMTQLVQDVITLMKNSDEYHSSLNIEFVSRDDHLLITGDEQQIKQIVWNLCINGIQAMSAGGLLRIYLESVENFCHLNYQTSKPGLVLVVKDQGCGILPDQMKKIFDTFYTTKPNGVGLGLATVQQVVGGMKGYIGVDSEVGKGARFTVFLPVVEPLFPVEKPVSAEISPQ